MNKNSKIYVAGHTGLVGSSILRQLSINGYSSIIVESSETLNLCTQNDVDNFFRKMRPDYVFLVAAKVGGIWANCRNQADFIYNNLTIATNVIKASYTYGIKKLLNFGSSCIYPRMAPQPLKEEYLLQGSLEPTNEPYAIAKIAAIKLCRYFNEQFGTNFISVMPTNVYGPNDNFNLETAHVLPALLRKFHLAKLLREEDYEAIITDISTFRLGSLTMNGKDKKAILAIEQALEEHGIRKTEVAVWGSGNPYREFLYVDDLAEASVYILENYNFHEIGEFVNIGVGKDVQIKELADIIKNIVGFEGGIRFDLSKPDGTPRKLLDISRLENTLHYKPKMQLEEGIKATYKWYTEKIRQGERKKI